MENPVQPVLPIRKQGYFVAFISFSPSSSSHHHLAFIVISFSSSPSHSLSISSPCVSESTTSNGIDGYEKHKHEKSEKRKLVPIPSYLCKNHSHSIAELGHCSTCSNQGLDRMYCLKEQICQYVRVVKETDLKSVGLRPRRRHISLHIILRGPRCKLSTSFRA
ncbi:hypothetical protein Lal_00047172 [Lupinus albus]|nr:hypothetical protein Lal_00047172 [Lupinus albus]